MPHAKKTLDLWLDELAQRHPQHTIRLGLERMQEAVGRMQLGQPNARVVTIAGTNGKGTCLMLLERLLHVSGYKVGAFQSPHMRSFCERVRINTQQAEPETIARSFDRIDALCGDLGLTFFEWNTLAALDIFHRHDLDILLLEVGLGGRLDAVNVIDNELSIITAIDYDHTDWLGDTLEQIAAEKAGVIRGNSQVVSHSSLPVIVTTCLQLQSQATYLDKDFFVQHVGDSWKFFGSDRAGMSVQCVTPKPNGCLADNLALALQSWLRLGFPLTESLTKDAFTDCVLPGRQQHIHHRGKHVLLDVAHNIAGLKALANRVDEEFSALPATGLIGMLVDKEAMPNLAVAFPSVQRWYALSLTGARGQNAQQLAEKLAMKCIQLESLDDMDFDRLMAGTELLIAMGSFHTCDAVHQLLDRD